MRGTGFGQRSPRRKSFSATQEIALNSGPALLWYDKYPEYVLPL